MSAQEQPRTPTEPSSAEPATTEPTATEQTATGPSRSLTNRWWWQSAVIVVAGLAVIGFQWDVIGPGQANAGNWVMAAVGAAAVLFGLWDLRRAARARGTAEDGTTENGTAEGRSTAGRPR